MRPMHSMHHSISGKQSLQHLCIDGVKATA
jgi:hypothetical protein